SAGQGGLRRGGGNPPRGWRRERTPEYAAPSPRRHGDHPPMTTPMTMPMTMEEQRLRQAEERSAHWRRWGPYLAERQWGTVREDYSSGGTAWDYFPHDHARSRAYRWGEDGLLGISDNHQRLCFALALW